jgi:hypothetical protein
VLGGGVLQKPWWQTWSLAQSALLLQLGTDLFWQSRVAPVSQYWLALQSPSELHPRAQRPLKQNSPLGQGLELLQSTGSLLLVVAPLLPLPEPEPPVVGLDCTPPPQPTSTSTASAPKVFIEAMVISVGPEEEAGLRP